MKQVNVIPLSHESRVKEILDQSWRIFKSHFINNPDRIQKEAPFQHHFAQIIKSVGDLYCTEKTDIFQVDLEQKEERGNGKSKYLDITCGFVGSYKCAIELKFKTAKQGAKDHGRIDAYVDLQALEMVTAGKYDLGKFYMITDSKTYINQSKKGIGTIFSIHDGFQSIPMKPLVSDSVGRKGVTIKLRNSYRFDWEGSEDVKRTEWYFLEMEIIK